ncbi:MAG: tetratricopeptide (TPR) repeat protein [Planctomycetota bacterium]|jgi:tetratricopeptide (TPR) repeat protein
MTQQAQDTSRPALLTIAVALVTLVFWAFEPALGAEFVSLDDPRNLVQNHAFRGLGGEHLSWMFSTAHMSHYQPLTWISFAIDHELAGLNAGAFHFTSVLLHAAATLAFFLLALVLLRRCVPGTRALLGSGLAAACFGLHPLRVESVAWITGRNDILAGLFAFLCAAAWVRHGESHPSPKLEPGKWLPALACAGLSVLLVFSSVELGSAGRISMRGLGFFGLGLALMLWFKSLRYAQQACGVHKLGRWLPLALVCFLLSLLSKASAVTLPAVLLLLDVWPLGRLTRADKPKATFAALLLEKTPFLVLSSVFVVLGGWAKSMQGSGMRSLAEHSFGERILQAAYGLGFYPSKTLMPRDLLPIYELPNTLSFSDPRFLSALLGSLLVFLLALGYRRSKPAWAATWFAFVLLILPTLGFLQSGEQLVADRYGYIACAPFALLLGGLLQVWTRTGNRKRQWVWGAAALMLVPMLNQTRQQSARWRDSASLYARGAELGQSPMLLSNLAMVRSTEAFQRPAERRALLTEALDLSNQAQLAAQEQQLQRPELWLHRGTILYNLQRSEEAVRDLLRFIELRPQHPEGSLNLALALNSLLRYEEALPHLEFLTQASPNLAVAWRSLGRALEGIGKPESALPAYVQANRLEPDNAFVRSRLSALQAP